MNEDRVHQLPNLSGIDKYEVILDGHDAHDGHTRWSQVRDLPCARCALSGGDRRLNDHPLN